MNESELMEELYKKNNRRNYISPFCDRVGVNRGQLKLMLKKDGKVGKTSITMFYRYLGKDLAEKFFDKAGPFEGLYEWACVLKIKEAYFGKVEDEHLPRWSTPLEKLKSREVEKVDSPK